MEIMIIIVRASEREFKGSTNNNDNPTPTIH